MKRTLIIIIVLLLMFVLIYSITPKELNSDDIENIENINKYMSFVLPNNVTIKEVYYSKNYYNNECLTAKIEMDKDTYKSFIFSIINTKHIENAYVNESINNAYVANSYFSKELYKKNLCEYYKWLGSPKTDTGIKTATAYIYVTTSKNIYTLYCEYYG